MGLECGVGVWDWSVGLECGVGVWDWSLGLECGIGVWGRNRCGIQQREKINHEPRGEIVPGAGG